MDTAGLIPRQTITTIVDNVAHARADIAEAFTLLIGAKDRLAAVLGDGSATYYGHLWTHQISDYHLAYTAAEVDAQCTRNAWRYVLEQTGLRSYMTEARQQELQAQLDKDEFPALTVENVLSTLQGLTSQVGTLLHESAKEVFDWLRPHSGCGIGALKTNKKFHIGSKAIVGWAVEAHYAGGYQLNSYRQANFRALGNVFSLLDGQGAQKYPDDLCTQLDTALRTAKPGTAMTVPYLACKPYKNGNMHLHFLRQDLVDRLNQIGSDGTLPAAEY